MAGELVEIGQITRPHGVRGELRVAPFTLDPESFCQFDRIIIQHEEQDERVFEVRQARPHKTSVLLQLEDVRDRDRAESLAGARIMVKREWLPQTEADEFYWTDLIGSPVFTGEGNELGRVINLLRTGAHDILVVDDHGREILIPFQDEFIDEVDIASKRISVTLPDGLLDI
jgi:16S rRNA processing protein RimM